MTDTVSERSRHNFCFIIKVLFALYTLIHKIFPNYVHQQISLFTVDTFGLCRSLSHYDDHISCSILVVLLFYDV